MPLFFLFLVRFDEIVSSFTVNFGNIVPQNEKLLDAQGISISQEKIILSSLRLQNAIDQDERYSFYLV